MGFLMVMLVMGMTVCAVDTDDIKKNRVFQLNSDAELHEDPDPASAITAVLPNGTPVIVKEDVKDGWCMVAYREQKGYVQISFLSIVGSQSTPVITSDQTVPENQVAQNSEVQSNDKIVQNSEVQSNNNVVQNGEMQPKDAAQPETLTTPNDHVQSDDEMTTVVNTGILEDEFKIIQEQNLLSYQEAETAKEQARSDRIWGSVIAVLVVAIFAVGIVTTLAGNKGKKREQ